MSDTNLDNAKLLAQLEFEGVEQAEFIATGMTELGDRLTTLRNIAEVSKPAAQGNPQLLADIEKQEQAQKLSVLQEWDRVSPSIADAVGALRKSVSLAKAIEKDAKAKEAELERITKDAIVYAGVPEILRGTLGTFHRTTPSEIPSVDDKGEMLRYFVDQSLAANKQLGITPELLQQPEYKWIDTLITDIISEVSSRLGQPLLGTLRTYAKDKAGDAVGARREQILEEAGISIFEKESFSFRTK